MMNYFDMNNKAVSLLTQRCQVNNVRDSLKDLSMVNFFNLNENYYSTKSDTSDVHVHF